MCLVVSSAVYASLNMTLLTKLKHVQTRTQMMHLILLIYTGYTKYIKPN